MSELLGDSNKKEILKKLIKELHQGKGVEEIKERFRDVLKGVTPIEIAVIEGELIKEGLPAEEVHELCDVHIAAFREELEKAAPIAESWHPISILMEEHKIFIKHAQEIKSIIDRMGEKGNFEDAEREIKELKNYVEKLRNSEKHYVREENVLFPYLEKHGIVEPPKIMWMDHDMIREIKKKFYNLFDSYKEMEFNDFIIKLKEVSIYLIDMLSGHFFRENNILFPTALKVISKDEWLEARKEFDEIGYSEYIPENLGEYVSKEKSDVAEDDRINFETGSFLFNEPESLLDTLPVDITFIDKDDVVRYFNQSKDRIFPRTKAVIGRKVQQCHPQKSVHVVNKILEDFKSGKRDKAEFWIDMNGRKIFIRYFPVRSKEGNYLGTIEVTQDITDIKKIEGEKRLLD
ncbi:MAG: DUF438 domain-containing protein [Caldiserica bacterium]|nr:MAG: DUF438 domain-containing protein [Caldisericota bacterium]